MLIYPSHFEIKDSKDKGKGVFTKKHIRNGNTAMFFDRPIMRPNHQAKITAVQIDTDVYLDTEPSEIRDFLNHSCDCNCKIDVENMRLVAIRDILPLEELTFNYCTTEFDLHAKNESFECHCNSNHCIGMVKGFNHLSGQQKHRLDSLLVPYLKKLTL